MVSFEDHVAYAEPAIQPVLRELRTRITALDPRVTEKVTERQRIAYRIASVFVEVKIQKKKVLARVFDTGLPDSKNIVVDIPRTHGWQHQKEISIDRLELVEYAMTFVAASYRESLQDKPRKMLRKVAPIPSLTPSVTEPAAAPGSVPRKRSVSGLEQWFETLPFPLASILRAWQATPSKDFKTKYEHLLHFFEGTAEFISIIFLSAYMSNDALFKLHKHKLAESMQKQKLSFERTTFGTWKLVVEYFGKRTRELLFGDKDERALCANIFFDQTLALPKALSQIELAEIIAATNKMRNSWKGHGGMVGQEEARLRNDQLIEKVQNLREVLADTWAETQLICALYCQPRGGVFLNEVAILMGSNPEFLKETRSLTNWLDVERLYLAKKSSDGALKLVPLVRVGSTPKSTKTACYFFNRLERDGARFISYHCFDQSELRGQFDEVTDIVKFLIAE
jgi:predicted transport protein